MLIKADQSCLIVIDVQERLVPAMQAPARAIRNSQTLMTAATRLDIPMLLTEQYPKGLGRIVPELQDLAKGGKVLEKMHFSCMNDPIFAAEFKALERRQAVIVGMEAHICVMQTGVNLMEQGYEIFAMSGAGRRHVVADPGERESMPGQAERRRRRHRHHRDGGLRVVGTRRHARVQGSPEKN
jgi:nicotinamidase-related amidase